MAERKELPRRLASGLKQGAWGAAHGPTSVLEGPARQPCAPGTRGHHGAQCGLEAATSFWAFPLPLRTHSWGWREPA